MEDRTGLTVIDPPAAWTDDDGVPDGSSQRHTDGRRGANVHGVVLAAGTSSRFGHRNKLLEEIDGTPLVVHATETLLSADLDGVTVVVGHETAQVRAALDGVAVDIRENDAYAEGQSTSVATGVAAARDRNAAAVLIALGDMPDVSPATIDLVIETYRRGGWDAIAAAYEGQRGNPVLFDRRYYDALFDVDGDVGGRTILQSDPEAVAVETNDPAVLHDVDRPTDI